MSAETRGELKSELKRRENIVKFMTLDGAGMSLLTAGDLVAKGNPNSETMGLYCLTMALWTSLAFVNNRRTRFVEQQLRTEKPPRIIRIVH